MEHSPKAMERYGISNGSNVPRGFNESLALTSYLKMRKAQPEGSDDFTPKKYESTLNFLAASPEASPSERTSKHSPAFSVGGSPFLTPSMGLGRQVLLSEDDNSDAEKDESGLGFIETVTDFTPTDARAMRLLVRTAIREKHVAEQHLLELRDSIENLKNEQQKLLEDNKKLTGFEGRLKKCKLPVMLLSKYSTWLHKLKSRLLARWKHSYMANTLGNAESKHRAMVFKVARRGILKWRAGKMMLFFRRWADCCTHIDNVETFKTRAVVTVVALHKKRMLFGILRRITVRGRMVVRLSKVMGRASLRDAFSKIHRSVYAAQQESTSIRKAIQLWVTIKNKSEASCYHVKNSFLFWKTHMQALKIQLYKKEADKQSMIRILSRIKNPAVPAFNKWKLVCLSTAPKMRNVARLFRNTIARMQHHGLSVAFSHWQHRITRFKELTKKIVILFTGEGMRLLHKGFQAWAVITRHTREAFQTRLLNSSMGMVRMSLRGWLSGKIRRAFRQWKVNAGFAAEFHNLLDKYHKHKHHHGKVYDELHGNHEAHKNKHQELHDRHHGTVKNFHLKMLNKALRRMLFSKLAKTFRHWSQTTMKQAMAQAADTQYQSIIMRRCAAVLRNYDSCKLSYRVRRCFDQWAEGIRKLNAILQLEKQRHSKTVFSIWTSWRQIYVLNKRKRKILNRIIMSRKHGLQMAAWRSWIMYSRWVGVNNAKIKKTVTKWLYRIQKGGFSRWLGNVRSAKLSETQNAHIVMAAMLGVSTLRTWFMRWTAFVATNKSLVKNTKRLVMQRFMARMQSFFDKWSASTVDTRNKNRLKQTVNRVVKVWTNKQCSKAWSKWTHIVEEFARAKSKRLHLQLESTALEKERLEEEHSTLHDTHIMLEKTSEKLFAQAAKLFASSKGEKLVRATFYTWKTNHLQLAGVKKSILGWMRKYDTAGIVKGFNKWARVAVFLKNEAVSKLRLKNSSDSLTHAANSQLSAYEKQLALVSGQSAMARVRAVLRSTQSRKLLGAWNHWMDFVDACNNRTRVVLWEHFFEWNRTMHVIKEERKMMNQVLRRITYAALWRGMARWKENVLRGNKIREAATGLQTSVRRFLQKWLQAQVRSGWMKWKHNVYQHRIKTKVIMYCMKKSNRLMGAAMRQWQRGAQQVANNDELLKRVVTRMQSGYKMTLYRKFNVWKQHVSTSTARENFSSVAARWVRAAARRWRILRSLHQWQHRAKESYMRVHGPPLVAAITRAQHAALSVTDAVLTTTSAKVVVCAAERACASLLPSHKVNIFCCKGDNYLWGTQASYLAPSYQNNNTNHSTWNTPAVGREGQSTFRSPNDATTHFGHGSSTLYQQAYKYAASVGSTSPIRSQQQQHHNGYGEGKCPDPWAAEGERDEAQNVNVNGTIVLLGEGVVGRCAAAACHAVYRAGPGLGPFGGGSTNHNNHKNSSSSRHGSPLKSTARFGGVGGVEADDGGGGVYPVLTAVVPLLYRGHVVGVLQITDPDVDSAGIFFNESQPEQFSPSRRGGGGGGGGGYYRAGHQHSNRANNSHSLNAMLDRLDDGDATLTADNLQINVHNGTGREGHDAVMMKELFCACLALQFSTATTAALTGIIAAVATTFGRHIVDGEELVALPHTSNAPEGSALFNNRYAWSPNSKHLQQRSSSGNIHTHLQTPRGHSPTAAGGGSLFSPSALHGGGGGGDSPSRRHHAHHQQQEQELGNSVNAMDAHSVLGLTVQLEQARAAVLQRDELLAAHELQLVAREQVVVELQLSRAEQNRVESDAAGVAERLRAELQAAHSVGKELQKKLRVAENKIRSFQMEHQQVTALNDKIRSVASTLY